MSAGSAAPIKYVIVPRRMTLLMYGKPDSINYTSALQISIMGDRATIDTLQGRDFYTLLKQCGLVPFVDIGLRVITAAMSPAHYRLAKRELRGLVNLRRIGETRVGHADLLWVELTEV